MAAIQNLIHSLQYSFDYLLHIDEYLFNFVAAYGTWAYALLFTIIFCETGLVVTPFLPGDSLIFAAGSLAANTSSYSSQPVLSIQLLFLLLTVGAILGNKTNYFIGRAIGPRVFKSEVSWWLNKKHLNHAHQFYEKHGGKTIIFARFLPIIRTFAPFVAGASYMSITRFSFFNIISGMLWVGSLVYAGYFFGNLPFIKQNFSIVIYSIVLISLIPLIILVLRKKNHGLKML